MLAPALLLDRVESLLRRFVERAAVQDRLELEIGLVLLPGAAELLAELAGDEVAVGPGVADGELADPPPGHTGGLVPDRVEEARGLHAVVAAAEAVQVLDRGGAAAGGVLEVELLDVVALADGHDVAVAAGDGADGVDEAQVLGHRAADPVGPRGGGGVAAPGRVGEDAFEGRRLRGELAGHARGDRDGAVERRGRVRAAQQGQDRHDDGDPEGGLGHLDAAGRERGACHHRVAQRGKRHGPALAGDVAVEVEGDRCSGLERLALGVLDGAGGGVETAAEREELGDRADDGEAAGTVAVRGGGEVDGALLAGRLLHGGAAVPVDEQAQLAVEALDVDRVELPGGDAFVDLAALVGGQPQHAAQQPLEPIHRQLPGADAGEAGGQVGDGDVRVAQAVLAPAELRAQSDRGGECVQGLLVALVLLGPEGGEVLHLGDVEGGLLLAPPAVDAQHRLRLGGAGCDVGALDEGLRGEGPAGPHGATRRLARTDGGGRDGGNRVVGAGRCRARRHIEAWLVSHRSSFPAS